MKYLCRTALFSLGILSLQAQAQTSAPASGLTMEQTDAFINESFQKQGDVTWGSEKALDITTFIDSTRVSGQSVQLENGCSLVKTSTTTSRHIQRVDSHPEWGRDETSVETLKTVLSLNRSDPLSVSVSSSSDATVHSVVVGRAVSSFRALDVPANAAPEQLPPKYGLNGIVRSTSGSSLTIVTGEGHLVEVTLDSNAQFSIVGGPGTASDIAVGDHLYVTRYTTTEGKGKKAQTNGHQSVSINKNTSAENGFLVGYFTDKDLAARVAKAFVHAIVLCHKDDKPSPF